ncbi:MAG TPA: serine/threonine-protein kinase [Kofleriaceae bacterium]|nr:serine/threonine-protein kinase [Kofleriaceae bacterium]
MEGAEQRQLAPGTMLDDKYRIDELLAVGGMGAVYVGTHIKLRKRIAIKVLNPGLATPLMIERFHREAITASQIGHEGIAQVTDLGMSSSGEPFLVMELLEGESLASRLKHAAPLPIDIACELGCMILSPLDAAHRAGIIHRDLKPDNVFLVRQSRGELVKLLDFGISRAQGLETEFRLTTTGLVLGTPYYMSPEQARGDSAITLAADIYSFGVILYEMLVGQVPILGDNYNQLMYRVMSGEYRPPRECRPEIPIELEQIVIAAMALDPTLRPRSAAELERALAPFCRPTFRQTLDAASGPFPRATPYPTPGAYHYQTGGPPIPTPIQTVAKARSKLPWVIGGVVIAAAIGVGAVIASSSSSPPKPVVATTTIAAPVAPPPTPAPTVTQLNITLTLELQPKDAIVTLDGKPVATTALSVAKDSATHHLKISAPGYVDHDEDLKFDESQKLAIELVADPKVTKPAQPAQPTGKTKPKQPTIESESPYGN